MIEYLYDCFNDFYYEPNKETKIIIFSLNFLDLKCFCCCCQFYLLPILYRVSLWLAPLIPESFDLLSQLPRDPESCLCDQCQQDLSVDIQHCQGKESHMIFSIVKVRSHT